MKSTQDMVWPHLNYTDKIHMALRYMFDATPHLSYTKNQMKDHIKRGYSWLQNNNEKQEQLLDKIIQTGIKKLIQAGKVVKVTSKVSVESQWQSTKSVQESGYTNITSEDSVALTDEAKKAIGRRAIGVKKLWELNQIQPEALKKAA